MTQENNHNELSTLQTWWNEISFPSKNQYELNESGELILKSNPLYKERIMATLTADNADIVLKALTDKFPEVEAKLTELQAEWDSNEDKLKLVGKLERVKEYLSHTNTVGDFEALHNKVAGMMKIIHQLTEENYQAKLKLVQQAEALGESENMKETSQAFRDLIEQWKQSGYTDKHRNDELWNRLEAARTKFFDRKRATQEDLTKELLQNLDMKMELVEKAEALANSENWKQTTEVFKQLMEEWKKTGRTIPEKNEALWNKFISAKNNFYDRKKVHFDSIQVEQEANYIAKAAIVEKAEELKDNTNWAATAQAYTELMDQWKKIGRVPTEKGDDLWNAFIAAKEHFFQAKKQHFESFKVSLEDNYAQKMALLKRAETIKTSNQWRESTDEMIEMMAEWKKIGPVPREHSNIIWEQFLAARKEFFDRKDAYREFRKEKEEKQKISRLSQAEQFLHQMEEELKEEEEKLEDFKDGIQNITPGRKAEELREHLEKLIKQTEHKIAHKKEKIADLQKQRKEAGQKEESVSAEEETAAE